MNIIFAERGWHRDDALSATAGWSLSTRSISTDAIFSPRRLMMSFLRSTKEKTVLVLPGVVTCMKPATTHGVRRPFRIPIIAHHQGWTLQEHSPTCPAGTSRSPSSTRRTRV